MQHNLNSMNPEPEIRHLLDLMPASGRMHCKIVSRQLQSQVIHYNPALPWVDRVIEINFNLWSQLPRPCRDLLLLRAVAWFNLGQLIKLDLYQGLAVAGVVAAVVEFVQLDPVGIVVSGGLAAFSGLQAWRNTRGLAVEIAADKEGIRLAQRRGYGEDEAADYLLQAITETAALESRPTLEFAELVRSQNLKTLAGNPQTIPMTSRSRQRVESRSR
ncbi:DUF3318 domain-containing protein [Thermosynechococcaceae cyanobacterium BACA0444]|uniref:DUF3318 domain-containing protein n=1 Tax=Pseudocalidococcus azoricus BACA0444 TaxID=2918990 RepID=A0AAE4JYI6_9CYAN|nr:DUF3318 domain-containing protein [Pseudocalidococcus azoricus]MDS3859752.1 DUF3318 domain-containing protein [Pseudocalidococcus azoricus BACA0444]